MKRILRIGDFTNEPTKIYALINLENNEVFYVGRTTQELHKRTEKHLVGTVKTNRVVNYIISSKSKEFDIICIEECGYNDATLLEEYWIQQMRAWGFPLVNKQIGNKNRYIRKRCKYGEQ